MDFFIIGICVSALLMVIVYYTFLFRPDPRTKIMINAIKESNFTLVMLASYIIFAAIFLSGMIFSSLSSWLILPIIGVTFIASAYYAPLKKNLSLMAWGVMSIAVVAGIFLDLDRARMSIWGIIALGMIALTLHMYNKEKTVWQ